MSKTAVKKIINVADRIIDGINGAIKKSPSGVSFISLKGYESKAGERSNVIINIGVDYEKRKLKDIKALQELRIVDTDIDDKYLGEIVKAKLINALAAPEAKKSEAQKSAYTNISGGLKVHNKSGKVYIWGLVVNKRVLVEGEYPKQKEKTDEQKIKAKLEKMCVSTSKYRMYVVGNMDSLKVNGDNIEI